MVFFAAHKSHLPHSAKTASRTVQPFLRGLRNTQTYRHTDHDTATPVVIARFYAMDAMQRNAQFTPPARHDNTVLSVSCPAV